MNESSYQVNDGEPLPFGTASISAPSAPAPQLVVDGKCLTGTIERLIAGYGAKPMDRAALQRSKVQAEDMLAHIVRQYQQDVASGEVGANGGARASDAEPLAGRCPTGLLYGRVQSGKTVAMIILSALAIDNGFRVIVVVTSNYLKLVEQTASRFQALEGPLVHSSTMNDDWHADAEHIRKNIGAHGLVVVCAKDSNHSLALIEFLRQVGAANYPAIILDDEADQASLDTTVAARSMKKASAPAFSSTIHRRLVQNDRSAELGESVRETLRHSVFVQVTATPYSLFLQNIDHPLRPQFTRLLEPGDGYTGGESFFADAHVEPEEGAPPLVFVDEDESATLENDPADAPPGLARAIAFFLLAAAAQSRANAMARAQGQNFLCHTSVKTAEHDRVGDLIRRFLAKLETDLAMPLTGETAMRMHWAYAELQKTLPEAPAFDELIAELVSRLHRRRIYIVNAGTSDVDFGRELNFVVGGNILGRGLTIDNLLVTYYMRRAKVSQMDTMLQHARMFGYRRNLMPYTRVFLPETLALRFHHIHASEDSLRTLFIAATDVKTIPVQVVGQMRPTRTSVLDSGTLGAYQPGQHIYPFVPAYRKAELADSYVKIEKKLGKLLVEDPRERIFVPVPITSILELLPTIRVSDDDTDRWNARMLCSVIESISKRHGDTGFIYHRAMERGGRSKSAKLPTGAVSREELRDAKAKDAVVLLLFHDNGQSGAWDNVPFWYPSLVFPTSMANQVFNTSEA